jgi:hypothetical protein
MFARKRLVAANRVGPPARVRVASFGAAEDALGVGVMGRFAGSSGEDSKDRVAHERGRHAAPGGLGPVGDGQDSIGGLLERLGVAQGLHGFGERPGVRALAKLHFHHPGPLKSPEA